MMMIGVVELIIVAGVLGLFVVLPTAVVIFLLLRIRALRGEVAALRAEAAAVSHEPPTR